jgi:hypothetical protein
LTLPLPADNVQCQPGEDRVAPDPYRKSSQPQARNHATTTFSNPKNNGTGDNWMGDYTGNTWVGDKFIAAWMDSSNGVDMQEVVGGVQLK